MSKRLGKQHIEVNTELRHSAFSRAELAVVPFKQREGMDGGAYSGDRLNKEPSGF